MLAQVTSQTKNPNSENQLGPLRFVTNPSWKQFCISFQTHLYQRPEYLALSTAQNPVSFGIAKKNDPELVAFISFQVSDGKAVSGTSGPFGSLDYNQGVGPKMLLRFLLYLEQKLKAMGVQQISIKLSAMVYQPFQIAQWQRVLESGGYHKHGPTSNHHLIVDAVPFENGLHSMEWRRLKKCQKLGLKAEQVGRDQLPEIYDFIESCRRERGQSLSMSWPQISHSVKTLPRSYLLFQVTSQGHRVAAAIVVRVNERILYHFYPASALEYQPYSPQVKLLDFIYQYARTHQYEVLDLGTSMVSGQPKLSLMQFKERVGGISSEKCRYEKSLI